MKRKIEVIIVISIVLLVIISAIVVFYILTRMEKYTLTIVKINEDEIIAADIDYLLYSRNINDVKVKDNNLNELNSSLLKVGDEIYFFDEDNDVNYLCTVQSIENDNINLQIPILKYYSFYIKDTKIKDIKGKNIDVSNLKIGDTIKVINWIPETTDGLAYSFEGHSLKNLENVKKIKVIEQNKKQIQAIENKNKVAIKEAIIANVNEDSIDVLATNSESNLINVKYPEEGNVEFEQGQKVLIYFNGVINPISNGIDNVEKIEIIKE